MWKEVLELRQDPRIFRHRLHRADRAAEFSATPRPPTSATCRWSIVDADRSGGEPGADQPIQARPSIFTLVDIVSSIERGRSVSRKRRARGWRSRFRRATAQASQRDGRRRCRFVADGSTRAPRTSRWATRRISSPATRRISSSETARVESAPERATGRGIEPRVRVWFNPTLESRYFMLPGIFALLLLVVTSNLSSMAIVARARDRHARAAERDAARPGGANRRQAAAVRASSA